MGRAGCQWHSEGGHATRPRRAPDGSGMVVIHSARLSSGRLSSGRLSSAQLSSGRLNSARLNSTRLSSGW